MHAVVGIAKLDPNRADEAAELARTILANMSQAPGFVSGALARSPDHTAGRSMVLFESEAAARAVAENMRTMVTADGPTEIVSLEVFEVVDSR